MTAIMIPRATLVRRDPFVSLFPLVPSVVAALAEDMRGPRGFDLATPVRAWQMGPDLVVLDGHMRLDAADQAAIDTVPIVVMEFADERAALEWTFQEQAERRRNLTHDELRDFWFAAITALDRPNPNGGDRGNQYTGGKWQSRANEGATSNEPGNTGDSAERTAALIGASPATVYDIRAINKDPEVLAEVKAKKIGLRKGADRARKKKKDRKAEKKQRAIVASAAMTEGLFDSLAALDLTGRLPATVDAVLARGVRRLRLYAPDRVAEYRTMTSNGAGPMVGAMLRSLGTDATDAAQGLWLYLPPLTVAAFLRVYELSRSAFHPAQRTALYALPALWLQSLGEQTTLTGPLFVERTAQINLRAFFPSLHPSVAALIPHLDTMDQAEVIETVCTIPTVDQPEFYRRWSDNKVRDKATSPAHAWAMLPDFLRPLLHEDAEARVIWAAVKWWHQLGTGREPASWGNQMKRMAGDVYGDHGELWRRWYDVMWGYGAALEAKRPLGDFTTPPWATTEHAERNGT